MTRIATSSSLRKPRPTARGRNRAAKSSSFIAEAVTAGFAFPNAFLRSKLAPMAIRPRGVAVAPTSETVFSRMPGSGIRSADQRRPTTMPMMIGLVTMPFSVFAQTSLSSFFRSGWKKESTTTAMML